MHWSYSDSSQSATSASFLLFNRPSLNIVSHSELLENQKKIPVPFLIHVIYKCFGTLWVLPNSSTVWSAWSCTDHRSLDTLLYLHNFLSKVPKCLRRKHSFPSQYHLEISKLVSFHNAWWWMSIFMMCKELYHCAELLLGLLRPECFYHLLCTVSCLSETAQSCCWTLARHLLF